MSYLSTLASLVGGTYNGSVFTSNGNLIAHWKLNDSSGTLNDSSTNGFDLTLVGTNGTQFKRQQNSLLNSDPTGKSIWFDGVSGHAWRIATTAINASQSAYTVNVWCQVDPTYNLDSTSLIGIRNKYQVNTYNTKRFEFAAYDDTATAHSFRSINSDFASNYGAVLSDNSYMVTAVWDGSTLSLYVNGVLTNSQAVPGMIDNTVTNAFGLANVGGGTTGTYFNGWLQHASLIKQALTASQIQTLYAAGASYSTALTATAFSWATTIVPSNPSRKKVTISNNSRSVVFLSLGGTATASHGIRLLPYGGRYENSVYTGDINAVISSPYGKAIIGVIEE